MTNFQLRIDPDAPVQHGAILLDWFPGSPASTVQSGGALLDHLVCPRSVRDLLGVAIGVYCADRVTSRRDMPDAWTRDINLAVPAAAHDGWPAATESLQTGLDFLTGDRWALEIQCRTQCEDPAQPSLPDVGGVDAVCLFSGGLDSLGGAIRLLEEGRRLLLAGHYEGGLAPGRQVALAAELATHYGRDRVELRQFFLRPAAPHARQRRSLPDTREETTRGRSLLFLAAGFAAAAGAGPFVPLVIPENGLIGINVPLTGSRASSLSTRTTHPHFLACVQQAVEALGCTNPLQNPYRLATKGELVTESPNATLLARLAPQSISCSHPEAARYARRPQGNCGYCYPCMIRRAALHAAGLDGPAGYAYDIAADEALILGSEKGASLRALLRSLAAPDRPVDVLRNGRVPADAAAFADVYIRGRAELKSWLRAAGGPSAKRTLT